VALLELLQWSTTLKSIAEKNAASGGVADEVRSVHIKYLAVIIRLILILAHIQ